MDKEMQGEMKGKSILQYEIIISHANLMRTMVILMSVASISCFLGLYVRWKYKRIKELEVIFIVLAYVFYIAYQAVLINAIPITYRYNKLFLGIIKPYPTFLQDKEVFIITFYVATALFWTLLWCIKLALLVLCRRLMLGLPRQLRWWKIALAFILVSWVFTFITTFTTCGGTLSQLKSKLTTFCTTPEDSITRNISFYGSYALDILTDIIVMVLPLRLIVGLQMSLRRKLAVGALFSIGVICILSATIRLVQISSRTKLGNPNPLWLALWGAIEATTAIVVGSLPALRFIRKTSSSTNGYNLNNRNRTRNAVPLRPYIPCENVHTATVCGGHTNSSSRESLAPKDGVLVTTQHQIHVENTVP